jgi:hypothetical protein
MPIDEYDFRHTTMYSRVIDVHRNSNIDDLIESITEGLVPNENIGELRKEIRETIVKLRGALEILDSRTVTCISGRVYYDPEPNAINLTTAYFITYYFCLDSSSIQFSLLYSFLYFS